MILKLLFITSYFILNSKSIGGYVLFAANIDDFRSMASKIISGQLADQLAVMAKNSDLNYRHDRDMSIDDGKGTSKDETSDDNSEESTKLDLYIPSKPSQRKVEELSKKRFSIKKKVEDIDLDELVKRVKEKLEKSYKIVKGDQFEEDVSVATKKGKKIEDYYYKDDFNADFNKDEPKKYTAISKYLNVQTNDQDATETPDYTENYAQTFNYQTAKEVYVYNNDEEKNEGNVKSYNKYVNVREVPQYNEKNTNHLIKPVTEKTVKKNNKLNAIKATEAVEYDENNEKAIEDVDMVQSGDIFKGVDMLKTNDSYEDYVTPKPDSESDSTEVVTHKTVKQIVNAQKFNADYKYEHNSRPKVISYPAITKEKTQVKANNDVVSPPTHKIITMKTPNPYEIKAKTGSMWYKDPNLENYDDSTKKIEGEENKPTTKRIGTMIPTRAHYKFSSPNYFAKLPVVAEKYNFDEPIPEKDREPEQIKHIGNPPAKINKKVKI